MANLVIAQDKPFKGAFVLETSPDAEPSEEETGYQRALCEVIGRMERDSKLDPDGDEPVASALRQARRDRRQSAIGELKAEANEYLAGKLSASLAAGNAYAIRGKYLADLERLTTSLFVVEPKFEGANVMMS